ncbi:MAG: hypothetical protein CMP56_03955 [Flavobacteriales bacterium]|nr:hypothetical protein [Flavobacteriales bacterium]|tara:strand:- start:390 stop:881 length:492 start_codon:yes stop_codon:yes gene_type:complete
MQNLNKLLWLIIIIPFISVSQKSYPENSDYIDNDSHVIGCVDLDETLIDLVSIFGDTSLLDGLLGCAELIPTLESGILSAFLPFDIPLDCNTDLTPFGYFDMNVSDICECSCQEYLNLENPIFVNRKIIHTYSILGQKANTLNLQLQIYDDGSVEKKYVLRKD